MPKKMGKSMAPPMAKKITSDGETRDAPATNTERTLVKQIAKRMATAKKPNLGGGTPPATPVRKNTPPPGRQMAIGERPMLGKTAAKIAKMRGR